MHDTLCLFGRDFDNMVLETTRSSKPHKTLMSLVLEGSGHMRGMGKYMCSKDEKRMVQTAAVRWH